MRLHGDFPSSAAWRVRIALNLKGIRVEHAFHHLRHGGQRAPECLWLNPQGLVPALETDGGAVFTAEAACAALPAFAQAAPAEQGDTE